MWHCTYQTQVTLGHRDAAFDTQPVTSTGAVAVRTLLASLSDLICRARLQLYEVHTCILVQTMSSISMHEMFNLQHLSVTTSGLNTLVQVVSQHVLGVCRCLTMMMLLQMQSLAVSRLYMVHLIQT